MIDHFRPQAKEFSCPSNSQAAPDRGPSQAMFFFVVLSGTLFAGFYCWHIYRTTDLARLSPLVIVLLGFKTLVEAASSYYGFTFVFIAAAYLLWRPRTPPARRSIAERPPVGILYLCCGDLDRQALLSLANLSYGGKLSFVIHDDSRPGPGRGAVDHAVGELRRRMPHEVLLLRRPVKTGGKAGAVNYALAETANRYDFFLLCDSDSTALDPLAIEKALPYFENPRVAIVQCRSVAAFDDECGQLNRFLSRSIDAFNAFLTTFSRFGWTPFVGHNALLRTSAVMETGGLTEGFFSDDLDLTTRLNCRGHRVVYAPEILLGEKHPGSYDSFRRRSYKWAYGCMQTLRAHAWKVLRTKQLTPAEKWSFFLFCSFYVGQTVLLAYLCVTFLVGPFLLPRGSSNGGVAMFAGALIILIIFLPLLAYFAKDRFREGWAQTLGACALIYGTMDFVTARGVWDGLMRRPVPWKPTNLAGEEPSALPLLGEAAFGLALLCVPIYAHCAVVLLPCFYLFTGKFLFSPAASVLYRNAAPPTPVRAVRRPEGIAVMAMTGLLFLTPVAIPPMHAGTAKTPGDSRAPSEQIRGKFLYVNAKRFIIKGMFYGPWRPGTGPNGKSPYPAPNLIAPDLKLIRNMNVNTIVVDDPPGYVLDLARKNHLRVLYEFYVDWWTLGTPKFAPAEKSILKRVREYREKPALLGWILGNEVPQQLVGTDAGERRIDNGLHSLYNAIKKIDPRHFITSANWPPTKELRLGFLDVTSFNVYPLWPPTVVARGYGNYIRKYLQPIAGKKPLLITEFGADTVEAGNRGQARLIRSSWKGLRKAGACGGVVFEFADEWWKNYDKPIRPGDWWWRVPDPNKGKTHMLDPEDYYGVMTAFRQPRPAAAVVREMYAPKKDPPAFELPAVAAGILVLLAAAGWGYGKWHFRSSSR